MMELLTVMILIIALIERFPTNQCIHITNNSIYMLVLKIEYMPEALINIFNYGSQKPEQLV